MSIDDIDLPEGIDDDDLNEPPVDETADDGAGKYDRLLNENSKKFRLSGMFKDWFLDYSSYVILYRAVPHIIDGLKPVQRRVLHAMHRIDDGSLTKVANIVGQAMQFHPHGDASILGALVTLGQKGLLIDCQGNWGNILTGDPNAAPRYIEARLSKFAKEVMFNPKTTVWMTSYDGRNQEPVNLPVKFPLLLAQGADGIAVGLASKILPHNFNELIDASIDILEGREFELYPDFPTGGFADCTRYNRGQRGGTVKVRARIEKIDKSTLSITEIPYGQTTDRLIESILKAKDKGKIKIKKIADLTTGQANIMIYLPNDVSPDKTIDALYAFTDCEVSISPNACVIIDDKPQFLSIDDILRFNTRHTEDLLGQELRIRLDELEADWHYSSLEKVFFENRVYKLLEADSRTWEDQLDEVFRAMKQYQGLFKKEIVMDDILKLVEKPVRKISKFDTKAVDEKIRGIEDEIDEVRNHLEHLTEFTVNYYRNLKKKYGKDCVRHTEITSFQNIAVTRVVSNNAKLYASYTDGFVGIALKKEDNAEYICDCSDMSEIIVFNKNGKYRVTKVSDKAFFGPDIIYAGLFDRNDQRTTYNVIYRDGRNGPCYAKRFVVGGVTRDKEYDITQGTEGSSILWFTANGNGSLEASSYDATLSSTEGITSNAHTDILRKARPRGSASAPYDLSTGGSDDLSLRNTANCYVVNAPGWYSFPLVYGNAVKDGKANTSAYISPLTGRYFLTNFINHLGNDITDPYINNNADCTVSQAELAWQDAKDLVGNISYEGSGPQAYIKFYVDPSSICQGNALITAKNAEGTIVWSWHIWVTDEDLTKTLAITNHTPKTYQLMPVYVGFCEGDRTTYPQRSCFVRIKTKGGDQTFELIQDMDTFVPSNAPYYQGGRKDPFTPSNGYVKEYKTLYDAS